VHAAGVIMTRIAIVAGGGELPRRLAATLEAGGHSVFILALAGMADPSLLETFEGEERAIGEISGHIRLLRSKGCEELVFAGKVQRPDLRRLRLDLGGAGVIAGVIAAAAKGDDALMRAAIRPFEEAGFRIRAPEDILGALLAQPGVMGAVSPGQSDLEDIRVAARAAAAIGALDIGQGAVACRGVVLALEAAEGTDRMLERCGQLPAALRGDASARAGVLVKRPKSIQDRRIDLPAIGPATLEAAAAAGLAGIAVEAGGCLVVDRDRLIREADGHGLFLYGFSAGEWD
jgi:hypothetical protein